MHLPPVLLSLYNFTNKYTPRNSLYRRNTLRIIYLLVAIKLAQYIKDTVLRRLRTYRQEKRIKNGEDADYWGSQGNNMEETPPLSRCYCHPPPPPSTSPLVVGEGTKEGTKEAHARKIPAAAPAPMAEKTTKLMPRVGKKAKRGKADVSTPAPSKPRRKGRISPVTAEDDKKGEDDENEDGFNPFSY